MSQFSSNATLAMSDFSQTGSFNSGSRLGSSSSVSGMSSKGFKRFFKKSPFIPFIVIMVIVFGIAIFAISNVISRSTNNAIPSLASTNKQVNVSKPVAQETLNKSFDFPLKDGSGKVVSKLHYVIQSAELDNQIIIKGQQATAVQGRTFLVLNLQITNSYDKSVQLNTRDYVRLIASSSTEKLAADIHNDPVEVQAISTKYTRLGFPISTSDASNLTLQVGEIEGAKQSIKLDLK
ncbi:MAG: hypothetical protein ACREHC_04215 [Candidatus Levyibacteriota bacterium]